MPSLVSQLTDPKAVMAAMDEYDELGRDEFLARYGYGRSRRYLLQRDGREYDVKAIVGVAFGKQFPDRGPLSHSELTSGLRTTVPKLRELGFDVVEHGGSAIRDALGAVMDRYDPAAKRGGMELDDLVAAVEEAAPVASREGMKVVRSMGVGRWPNVAWLALLDSRETESTRRGVYPVYLFRSDLRGLYLTLNQGVEQSINEVGVAQTLPALERRAQDIRGSLQALEGTVFLPSTTIDLGPQKGKLARSYEAGGIVARYYHRDRLPSEAELESDLEILLSAYDEYLEASSTWSPPPTPPADRLAALAEEWKAEVSYPRPVDEKVKKERVELAGALTEDSLLAAIDDPARFSQLEFSRFAGQAAGGPGPMAAVNSYLNSGDDAKVQVAQAMRHLLYDGGKSLAARINDVLLGEEWSAEGFKVALVTKALWITKPDEWIPVFNVDGDNGKRVLIELPELGIDVPEDIDDLTPGRRIEWTNEVLRDRLRPLLPGDTRAQSEFLYWLRDRQPEAPEPESLDVLAEKLLVEPDWLKEVVSLMEEKGQVIFQGPPGTGKTFVARELARYFERLGGGCEIVQFHPSYSYEDFVEGYRPRVVKGRPGFELTSGPLLRLAKRAEADKEHTYVLVIDELNRGNVAKVFGELYFLLEYRGERIRLQYAHGSDDDSGFALPRNLRIIATMNTADRSIALMDGALRRRFYFVDYFPDQPPVSKLLERWLQSGATTSAAWLPNVLAEANRKLDREAAIGPSYFMADDPASLTDERIERIWRHAVIPYLEERLIGSPDRLADFALPSLKKAIDAHDPEGSTPADEPDGGGASPQPDVG